MIGTFKLSVIYTSDKPEEKWYVHQDNIIRNDKGKIKHFFHLLALKKTYDETKLVKSEAPINNPSAYKNVLMNKQEDLKQPTLPTDRERKFNLQEYLDLSHKLKTSRLLYNKKKDILIDESINNN